jgi:hypothetical protein
MNARDFTTLTTIILATQLSQPVAHVQVPQLLLNSMLNDVLVQRSSKSPNLQVDLVAPLPNRGAPDNRSGGASHAAPSPVEQQFTPTR